MGEGTVGHALQEGVREPCALQDDVILLELAQAIGAGAGHQDIGSGGRVGFMGEVEEQGAPLYGAASDAGGLVWSLPRSSLVHGECSLPVRVWRIADGRGRAGIRGIGEI